MANRPAPALTLREEDREELSRLVRASTARAGSAQRARIVLLSAQGFSNTAIAELVGVSRPTVIGWRRRYQAMGLAGLEDELRSGRPRTIDHEAVVSATLVPPPKELGVTHWSTRLLARHLGISDATVAKAWREYRVPPWRAESFRFSTDPELVAKVVDVVGLYLNPPENAVVLCVDRRHLPFAGEESRIQAADRTGTATLFAALEIATGRVTGACTMRHRPEEFLAFVRQVGLAYPDVELHLVMDNDATHGHPHVDAWLAENPRVRCHFTPTNASWMNLVEVWFSLIERQAIRRGVLTSVGEDLEARVRAVIDGWNERAHPFVWTKTAEEILARAIRDKTASTGSKDEPPWEGRANGKEPPPGDGGGSWMMSWASATPTRCQHGEARHALDLPVVRDIGLEKSPHIVYPLGLT